MLHNTEPPTITVLEWTLVMKEDVPGLICTGIDKKKEIKCNDAAQLCALGGLPHGKFVRGVKVQEGQAIFTWGNATVTRQP